MSTEPAAGQIPFFGAGISRPHLGIAAAELAHDLATEVGAPHDTLLSDVSDMYVDQRGEPAFIDFLKRKLVVATLDDSKASTHRLLLSLGQNVLYTTNQDNIFELTAKTYGRPYRRIVTIDDLSDAKPGERLLIKFHGDTDVPSSLVFGARSYRARLEAEGHPLDIKLRADLLGKRLLFLGYSFSDENVSKLIDSPLKDTVRAAIHHAWQGSRSRFPLEGFPNILPHKGFHEIMRDMQGIVPARFRNPESE